MIPCRRRSRKAGPLRVRLGGRNGGCNVHAGGGVEAEYPQFEDMEHKLEALALLRSGDVMHALT